MAAASRSLQLALALLVLGCLIFSVAAAENDAQRASDPKVLKHPIKVVICFPNSDDSPAPLGQTIDAAEGQAGLRECEGRGLFPPPP